MKQLTKEFLSKKGFSVLKTEERDYYRLGKLEIVSKESKFYYNDVEIISEEMLTALLKVAAQ